eukprot:93518_1
MATVPMTQQLKNDLTKAFDAQQYTTEENVPFSNPSLYKQLTSLRNDANFSPLIAHDNETHKHFAPSSSINTWQIVFNEQWQSHDRNNKFNHWCDALLDDELLEKLQNHLDDWKDILNVPYTQDTRCEWFRPPTFPSTLQMSLEQELSSDWSTFYKDNLKKLSQGRYSIHFNINNLYSTMHCNLIDAIYFAKCVNWDAAYDPKHSAKTNIPIYWIFAEISFDFPSANGNEINGQSTYSPNTFSVPISCFGLMHAEVNAIKDWYKLSPHCEECRDVRARLQIHDDVEVFVGKEWRNGTIIDCVIMNHNEVNSTQTSEPIVEYLQIQTTNDAIIRYNRYDDRLRPCLNTQHIEYDSQLLLNHKEDETEENEPLLTPPSDINIEQNAPPSYDIGNQTTTHNTMIPMDHEQGYEVKDPRIKIENDEYKVDALPTQEPMNEDLLNAFDHRNAEIMKQYQNDLRETMETMQKLALRRTVATDIFRPVHLVCPKLSYRVLLSDENEVNLTVLTRNDAFDYIALKMIDTEDVELSEMTVFMTKKQLFEHCTTYFHFADMNETLTDEMDFDYANRMQEEKEEKQIVDRGKYIQHNVPPHIAVEKDQSLGMMHQYMRQKTASISPKRRVSEPREESKEDPRSHLQDEVLCSFLHDDEAEDKQNKQDQWISNASFVKAESMDSNSTQENPFDINATQNGFIMSAQQQFIESNQMGRGLGCSLMDQTDDSICGGASVGGQSLTYHDEHEPGTPKMLSGSPSASPPQDMNSTMIHSPIEPEMTTKGMDCSESDEEDQMMENTKARASVKRVSTAPNDGKYEENENGNEELKFDEEDHMNDIGINQYDPMDDEINDLNDDLDEVLDEVQVPIERVYTVNRWVVLVIIILSILLVPILSPYLPEKYRHSEFDYGRIVLQWKPYWNDLVRRIEEILSRYGLLK